MGAEYEQNSFRCFSAAGNNFELGQIAVAIARLGLNSGPGLQGVIGPLVEVSCLNSIGTCAFWLRKRY